MNDVSQLIRSFTDGERSEHVGLLWRNQSGSATSG